MNKGRERSSLESEVLRAIGEILADELDIHRALRPEETLVGDVGLDSLGITTLAVGLEDRFHVFLSEDDVAPTVGELARLVAERVRAAA